MVWKLWPRLKFLSTQPTSKFILARQKFEAEMLKKGACTQRNTGFYDESSQKLCPF